MSLFSTKKIYKNFLTQFYSFHAIVFVIVVIFKVKVWENALYILLPDLEKWNTFGWSCDTKACVVPFIYLSN